MYESYYYHPEAGYKTGLTPQEIAAAVKDERATLWVDLLDMDDSDIDLLTSAFDLHPLTIEDFIMPNARPKLEEFVNYLFLVFFSMELCNGSRAAPTVGPAPNGGPAPAAVAAPGGGAPNGKIRTAELDCCLGRNFLITYHNEQCNALCTCKERIKKQSPMIMHGADMLLYSILDLTVDNYFPLVKSFDDSVDEMSDELFRNPSQETLKKIFMLKNDAMTMKRMLGPQADVISLLSRGTFKFIPPANVIYFRNTFDNMIRLNDLVGTSRDIITGAMEAYVSIASNRLNEIMKTLTIITTTMMPLTLLASIYGMNFKYMPELDEKFAYPGVLLSMALIIVFMLLYFKRRKWL